MRIVYTRRLVLAGALASGAFAARAQAARLKARPLGAVADPLPPGLHKLALPGGREARLLVPAAALLGPRPLMLMLHGSDQRASTAIRLVRAEAEAAGVTVLATQSSGRTWDLRSLPEGDDAATIDGALAAAFARVATDPARIASAGFSDGATYALSLGLINGDLFSDVLAFSAGGVNAPLAVGRPRLFFSHGRRDFVLRFAVAEQLAARFRSAGYDVEFRAFEGGHDIPGRIAAEALARLTGGEKARA